jgi:hypothetical protein
LATWDLIKKKPVLQRTLEEVFVVDAEKAQLSDVLGPPMTRLEWLMERLRDD